MQMSMEDVQSAEKTRCCIVEVWDKGCISLDVTLQFSWTQVLCTKNMLLLHHKNKTLTIYMTTLSSPLDNYTKHNLQKICTTFVLFRGYLRDNPYCRCKSVQL